jgi:hypothetical protein
MTAWAKTRFLHVTDDCYSTLHRIETCSNTGLDIKIARASSFM